MKLTLTLIIAALTFTTFTQTHTQPAKEQTTTVTIEHTQPPIAETIITPVEAETTPIPEPIKTCPTGTTPLEVLADGTHTSCLPDECWHMTVSEETPQCLYGIKP